MRRVLAVIALTAPAAVVATAALAGGAPTVSVAVGFGWSGNVFQIEDIYATTVSRGFFLTERRTDLASWYTKCVFHTTKGRLRGGEALYCADYEPFVAGQVHDENPDDPSRDCTATYSWKSTPNGRWPFGGTLVTTDRIKLQAAAPVTDLAQLTFRVSGSSLTSGSCQSSNFLSTGPPKTLTIGKVAKFGTDGFADSVDKEWQLNQATDQSTLHETFSSRMAVVADTTVYERPRTFLDDVNAFLDAFVTGIVNNIPTNAPPLQQVPTGSLQGTGTTGGGRRLSVSTGTTVFTINERFRQGAASPLRVTLTPAGRAALRKRAGAPVQLTLTFTPASGAPLTLHATLRPVVLPAIDSVSFGGTPAEPTIAVHGHGLAPLPVPNPAGSPAGHGGCPGEPGPYGLDYGLAFNLNDLAKQWSAGMVHGTSVSCIGLVVTKATASEVDCRLGSFYTRLYPKFSLDDGDQVQIVVNGAVREVHVKYGATVTG